MQLLGEEINTKEAVLASCWRSGDLNDLAGAALKNHNIFDVDVVGRNSDRVGNAAWGRMATG